MVDKKTTAETRHQHDIEWRELLRKPKFSQFFGREKREGGREEIISEFYNISQFSQIL